MKVLVACEMSGRVRDAFIRKGHEAMSCDILPSMTGGPHYQGNVFDILEEDWDLIIAHPPCTKLTVAANRWYHDKPDEVQEAAEFATVFFGYAEKVCVENPIGRLSTLFRKPDQIIQPYDFGADASKRTCLWLQQLPLLQIDGSKRKPGRLVEYPQGSGRFVERWENQTDSGQNRLGPSDDRAMLRSLTYPEIAEAMAEQWG